MAQDVDRDVAGTDHGDHRPDAVAPLVDDAGAETLMLPPFERFGGWRARWPLLVVLVWVALAAVSIVLFGFGSSAPKPAAGRTPAGLRATTTARPSPAASGAASRPAPSAEPTAAVQVLAPVGATAYGPAGQGSGDNTSDAVDAIDGSVATAWQTDWYRSAAFGNLQAGTGLLIDMGRPVTMTSVRIVLGATPGADLELLTGNTPAQADMLVQGSVTGAGGTISLTLAHPEPARYLLIWFTQLPPDSTGTYQAAVYDVSIEGTP
jgi:hypothetical protein